jgi:hypothetical protein
LRPVSVLRRVKGPNAAPEEGTLSPAEQALSCSLLKEPDQISFGLDVASRESSDAEERVEYKVVKIQNVLLYY